MILALLAAGSLGASVPAADKTPAAARAVVRRYYAAIERRQYRAAYREWSGGGAASGQSYATFAHGFRANRAYPRRRRAPDRRRRRGGLAVHHRAGRRHRDAEERGPPAVPRLLRLAAGQRRRRRDGGAAALASGLGAAESRLTELQNSPSAATSSPVRAIPNVRRSRSR